MSDIHILGLNSRDLLEDVFCKPNAKIKKLKNNLLEEYRKLEKIIEEKKDFYNRCSYKWQESERGENKFIEIQQLEGMSENLLDVIESLKYYYKLEE